MLLRKHLEGGIIESIEQQELERIVHITVRSRNEIGDESQKNINRRNYGPAQQYHFDRYSNKSHFWTASNICPLL
ncbi:hypothetical protein GCM10020331_046880 [Ectobacillus funiculus]